MTELKDLWAEFDSNNHLQPEMKTVKFESLHLWDLGWELLEPLDIASSDEHEIELSKRFSPGQKALYFFWYLDGQVTNGGFVQFYWNGYAKYLPAIYRGLGMIGDKVLIKLLDRVHNYLVEQLPVFQKAIDTDDFEGAYELLPEFEDFDEEYYELHEQTMGLIEKYARSNPKEFVKLT